MLIVVLGSTATNPAISNEQSDVMFFMVFALCGF